MTTLILCFRGNKEKIEREARGNNPHAEFEIVDLSTDPLPLISKKNNLDGIIVLGKIAHLAIPDLEQYILIHRDLSTELPKKKEEEEEKKEKKAKPLSKYKMEELLELLVKGETFSCEVSLPGKQIVTIGEDNKDINLKELILLTMIQSILKDSVRVIRITPRERRNEDRKEINR